MGAPIGWALNRTGEVLFRPFQVKKWFILALPAGLTLLMETGGGFSFNNSSGGPRRGGGGGVPSPAAILREIVQWIHAHLALVVAGAVVLFIVGIACWIVGRWLNCRGRFMFFDNLVNNDTRIKVPWDDFREIANSLWVVRLVWDAFRWVINMGVMVLTVVLLLPDLRQFYESGNYIFTWATGTALLVGVPLFMVIGVVFWVADSILLHLAVPVMYIRRMRAMPAIGVAWRELFLGHMGASLLYFLWLVVVQFVWVIWFMITLLITCCVTLCIGYILALLPFVGSYVVALITLPVLTFKNAYRLYFVSQFGDEYRIGWQVNPQGGFPVIPNDPQTPNAFE
jgi:hypothetical protein